MSLTNTDRRDILIYSLAGVIPVVWIALLVAPYWQGNLFEVISRLDEVFARPLHIQWTEASLRAVFFCLLAYAMGIFVWLSSRKNYRRGEEHGSAKWGDAAAVNRKYRQKPESMNKVLTQHVITNTDLQRTRGRKCRRIPPLL